MDHTFNNILSYTIHLLSVQSSWTKHVQHIWPSINTNVINAMQWKLDTFTLFQVLFHYVLLHSKLWEQKKRSSLFHRCCFPPRRTFYLFYVQTHQTQGWWISSWRPESAAQCFRWRTWKNIMERSSQGHSSEMKSILCCAVLFFLYI